jgi:VWFA-related protein
MKFSTILLILLFALSAFSQDYEVSVTEVMVWVKATDRSGKAITNLTQSDFELFEDDQKMTPTCFEEVTFSAALVEPSPQTVQSQPAETMPATAKRVVLILDLYNTQQAEYLYVRPKITEFLKQLPANWEVALATMIPGTIEINIPFTNKMKDIETKLDQITANSKRDIEVLNRRRSILNLLDRGAFPKIIEEAYRLAGGYATEEKDMARQSLQALRSTYRAESIRNRDDNTLTSLNEESEATTVFLPCGKEDLIFGECFERP